MKKFYVTLGGNIMAQNGPSAMDGVRTMLLKQDVLFCVNSIDLHEVVEPSFVVPLNDASLEVDIMDALIMSVDTVPINTLANRVFCDEVLGEDDEGEFHAAIRRMCVWGKIYITKDQSVGLVARRNKK